MNNDIGLTDAQYGLLTGYAYYLLNAVAMALQGYFVEKYEMNRVKVVGYISLIGAGALILQVIIFHRLHAAIKGLGKVPAPELSHTAGNALCLSLPRFYSMLACLKAAQVSDLRCLILTLSPESGECVCVRGLVPA